MKRKLVACSFSGCWASFVYSCDFILECYNLFSGAKLSTTSFCFIIGEFLRPIFTNLDR